MRRSGELGPEEAKEFRDTGKDGGEEHTQKGAECAERSSQIHVLVVSAESGGKQRSQRRIPALSQVPFRNTGPKRVSSHPNTEIAVRVSFHGTHTGEFQGVPATGREIHYVSHEFYRVEDGLIAEEWI